MGSSGTCKGESIWGLSLRVVGFECLCGILLGHDNVHTSPRLCGNRIGPPKKFTQVRRDLFDGGLVPLLTWVTYSVREEDGRGRGCIDSGANARYLDRGPLPWTSVPRSFVKDRGRNAIERRSGTFSNQGESGEREAQGRRVVVALPEKPTGAPPPRHTSHGGRLGTGHVPGGVEGGRWGRV